MFAPTRVGVLMRGVTPLKPQSANHRASCHSAAPPRLLEVKEKQLWPALAVRAGEARGRIDRQ